MLAAGVVYVVSVWIELSRIEVGSHASGVGDLCHGIGVNIIC